VNVAFFALAEIEDAARIFTVNENSGLRIGALPASEGKKVKGKREDSLVLVALLIIKF